MSKKQMPVGDGYSVCFDERARGEESPYWRGRIFKEGVEIGSFRNDGRGGMTMIRPAEVVTTFQKIVDDAGGAALGTERESALLIWAEARMSKRGATLTLGDVLSAMLRPILVDASKPEDGEVLVWKHEGSAGPLYWGRKDERHVLRPQRPFIADAFAPMSFDGRQPPVWFSHKEAKQIAKAKGVSLYEV